MSGGYRSAVVRDGETVRRSPSSEFVIRLLRFLEERQWPFSPKVLEHSPESTTLAYVHGQAAVGSAERRAIACPEALATVARMTRSLHDVTAGTACADGAEVVCHNDLDPRNTVYRWAGQVPEPVAFIDWDLAAPGARVHDLAHVCWTFTGLGPGADRELIIDRIRLILSAYGWEGTFHEVVEAMLWWQDRCWRGIDEGADHGDASLRVLREGGVVEEVRGAEQWTCQNL